MTQISWQLITANSYGCLFHTRSQDEYVHIWLDIRNMLLDGLHYANMNSGVADAFLFEKN